MPYTPPAHEETVYLKNKSFSEYFNFKEIFPVINLYDIYSAENRKINFFDIIVWEVKKIQCSKS